MTVHTAKGLEFPYVFVAGMEENLFPSGGWMLTPKDLEEERRLFYVAITRAKKAVALTFADTRMRNGKHESNSPSRFLRELAPQYLANPLRKEDFERGSQQADEDFGPRGFRFGGYGGGDRGASRKPASADTASAGVSWRSKSAMPSAGRTSMPSAGRSVMPGPDRASLDAPKPPVIDPNFVPDPMTSFKVGDRIEHNRFGAGVLLEISGIIPDLKAKVRFDQYGEKLLLLKFAKIRHK